MGSVCTCVGGGGGNGGGEQYFAVHKYLNYYLSLLLRGCHRRCEQPVDRIDTRRKKKSRKQNKKLQGARGRETP